ncbi:MAG: DUF3810 domain-containing protein [Clostridia bacterium]|nr:DUF3810 domain-containing protein [Clostridia bacterium]
MTGKLSRKRKTEENRGEPVKLKLPRCSVVFFIIFALSAVILGVCFLSTDFADFFCRRVASGPRALLAWLTAVFPFSLIELIVILIIPIALFVIVRAARKAADSWHNAGIVCLTLLSVLSLFFSVYVFTLGTGYRGSGLDEKLGMTDDKVSAEELKKTAEILADEIGAYAGKISYGADGFSVMPYGVTEMTSKLGDAFAAASKKYAFLQSFRAPIKQVMLSEPWTYTHITGMYSYFTGEANLNINMPDYTLPFTAAHEMAHQRGIAREDEANFVAYLVCLESDDDYIRYTASLNMYEYVVNALYSADSDGYTEVMRRLEPEVRAEMTAYGRFFSKYRRSVVATVSEKVNDTYLKINGTPGTKSYGMVVDLCVAFYRDSDRSGQ